ncbi:MAG: hypothetical protein P4L65_01290 [Legionella sp.]|nr:hypothetical protein [Legionella sp.]
MISKKNIQILGTMIVLLVSGVLSAAINLPTAAITYTLTSNAEPTGTISPSGILTVNKGTSLTYTATPKPNYVVYQWLVDGVVAQGGGVKFLLKNVTANHTIKARFINTRVLYSATQSGELFFSYNAGGLWKATALKPAGGAPIKSIYATTSTLYASSSNGFIYYSTNNGASWVATKSPDTTPVNSIFLSGNKLYAGTSKGFVYYSINQGSTWTATHSPDGTAVNAVYVVGTTLYAAARGYVYYSTNNGVSWTAINGQVNGSAIKSIYVVNNKIYVGTAIDYIYTSTSVTGGGSWAPYAQNVSTLFVSPNSIVYAGTQNGYVYTVADSVDLGFVTYSPITSLSSLL